MTRPQQRAPKGRTRDRDDRRAVVDVLLARAQRGALSTAEGALLAEHVREEQRLADATRRAMAGTTQALDRHREAADAAIVEAEQRTEAVEEQLARTQAERDRLARDVEAMHDGINQAAREAYGERRQHRQALAEQRARLDQVLAVLARVRNAEALGDALAAVAEHDGLSPTAARIHGRMLDRADTTEARLAEQQREHDIALATQRRRAEGWKRHTREAERQAGRYRIAWLAARRDRQADRAAMAAELPLVQAGQQALASRCPFPCATCAAETAPRA
ncbi:hypothetical protein [Streptomyces silvensis]|uniref:Uncharacterized protein n=1 Tax=Streptomyces silvensis TaxID=1765722 RepID=A0A0W7XA02_9ACTN|nr:hypothetical protein [Streptomyces silvensis]KUF19575.1 hypothetical protein AT728_04165 [Streptomyces silvensis]